VYSIRVGQDEGDDQYNGFFKNINDQVAFVCDLLSKDPKLSGGFNAVGFSQGSQFLRAYVQRCNSPPVRNLISVGGQHQGVFGLPHCPGENSTLCELMRELLDNGAYISWIQSFVVQAEYWHDPLAMSEYYQYNVFLPDINNALPTKNATYKANLLKLSNFVMVQFLQDTMVEPKESEWFGFYADGQDVNIVSLNDSALYKEDWLGLQQLDTESKLHFLTVDGDHLQFTDTWFIENIIKPFLQ